MANWTPNPSVNFEKIVAESVLPPLQLPISGELTSSVSKYVFGAARVAGEVKDVWISVGASGKDDTNPLQVTGEISINGTSCLSTKPSIAHVSGEASQQKTTAKIGDTGIAQAVLDYDNNTFVEGDVFTCDLTLVRTSSPTTEMSSIVVCVELEPS